MVDQRVVEHARVVVNHSCKVKRGDFVIIVSSPEARELAIQVVSELGRIGARYIIIDSDYSVLRAFSLSADDETLSETAPQFVNLVRDSDVFINLGQLTTSNSQETSDVPPHKLRVRMMAMQPVAELVLTKRWNITLHPTPSLAQDAGMSFEAYCDFVYSAVLRDWSKMEKEMKVLNDKMLSTKAVRIVGKDTDISMSIEGRKPMSDIGEKNLPGGEVFTSPVDSSVNGKVYFDLPIVYLGHEIKGARLVFKDGVVTEASAEEGSDLLREMLSSDEGARRLGELGIGMNRGINRFTRNILFDEKMGDTIHMAIGRAFEEVGGTNKSAIHIDMIKRMKDDGAIYLDETPIYSNGKFQWE